MTGSRVVFLVVLPVLLDVVYVTGDPLSYVGFVCLCMCRSPVALFCFVAANRFFFLVSAPFSLLSLAFLVVYLSIGTSSLSEALHIV